MKSPFKFLDSYTKDDRAIFFGRDREIEELYHRVFESRIMLVYGVSGTGKSSLIHCGLANKFQDTDWLPIVIRRGGNIIDSMSAGIRSASLTDQQTKFSTPSDFKKGVRSLYLDHYKPVFFIFDQFEELFIFGDKEERISFIHIVKLLTESELQCRMIFVMREEYMAGVTEFEKFIPTFFSNRVRIEKMSHLNALEAIKQPCKVFNISLEEGFAESLLEKLSPGETDVELTYLQVYLDKIFRLAAGFVPPPGPAPSEASVGESKGGYSPTPELKVGSDKSQGGSTTPTLNLTLNFTLSLLSKTGNVSDLLGSFLDDQISLMEDPDNAMSVLKAFVSGKGTKRPASEQEAFVNIHSFGKEISPETVKELIQSFVKLRVLRDKDDNGRYELRHDALAEKVYEKFSTAEKELLEIRQFIENAFQAYIKRKVLLSDEDLKYIGENDSLLNLNSNIKEFFSESRMHIKARIKTVRRLTAVSAVLFAALFGILIYFAYSRIIRVKANYTAIKSITQVVDPVARLNLAFTAWESYPDVLPKEAILKAFNCILGSDISDTLKIRKAKGLNLSFDAAPVKIEFAACTRDNSLIYGYGDSLIMIWDTKGKLISKFKVNNPHVIDIKISSDNKFIGTVSSDSILEIHTLEGLMQFERKTNSNILNTRQIFQFTNKNNIVFLSTDNDVEILDINGNLIQSLEKHCNGVNAVDISDNNYFIATASSDHTINIWYLNNVKNRYDYYNTLRNHTDTVWSATFSRGGLSILSASADGTVEVRSINDDYIDYPRFPANLKYCDALFTDQERGIIASLYYFRDSLPVKLYTAIDYNNPAITVRSGEQQISGLSYYVFNGFESLSFSSNEDYFSYSLNDSSYLADNRLTLEKNTSNIAANHVLMAMQGTKPFFSSDSKYVFSLDSNLIKAYFIDIDTILGFR